MGFLNAAMQQLGCQCGLALLSWKALQLAASPGRALSRMRTPKKKQEEVKGRMRGLMGSTLRWRGQMCELPLSPLAALPRCRLGAQVAELAGWASLTHFSQRDPRRLNRLRSRPADLAGVSGVKGAVISSYQQLRVVIMFLGMAGWGRVSVLPAWEMNRLFILNLFTATQFLQETDPTIENMHVQECLVILQLSCWKPKSCFNSKLKLIPSFSLPQGFIWGSTCITKHCLGAMCYFKEPHDHHLTAFKGLIPEEEGVGKHCIVLHQRNMRVNALSYLQWKLHMQNSEFPSKSFVFWLS